VGSNVRCWVEGGLGWRRVGTTESVVDMEHLLADAKTSPYAPGREQATPRATGVGLFLGDKKAGVR
jgi:hypothetical protein